MEDELVKLEIKTQYTVKTFKATCFHFQAHNVDEDIKPGTSILKVKAMDSDSGSNAEIEYYVSDDHFTVNSNGVISNNKKLDADSNNAYYEFIVTAKDKGEPPRTGKHTLIALFNQC